MFAGLPYDTKLQQLPLVFHENRMSVWSLCKAAFVDLNVARDFVVNRNLLEAMER